MGFSTDCIHAGNLPDPSTGAVAVPIYQTSTYVQEGLGKHKGYEYARTQNPTRHALEENLAALEGGAGARAFASGMAAIDVHRRPSSRRASTSSCSNMTLRRHLPLLHEDPGALRARVHLGRHRGPDEIDAAAIRPTTKMLYIETPTNPVDAALRHRAASKIAHERGIIVVVDNTFMCPYFQQPIALGADIVVHSTTKFLNGHSDSSAASRRDEPERRERIALPAELGRARSSRRWTRCSSCAGSRRSPFAWSATSRTAARSRRCYGAPKVRKVHYPGLPIAPAARAREAADARASAG